MRLNGQPLHESYAVPVTLPRPDGEPLRLVLSPLSIGFQRRLRDRGFAAPVAPLRIVRDSSGRPLRDGDGQAITHRDTADADYLRDLERHHQRVALVTVVEGLRADDGLELETPMPAESDPASEWIDYADRLAVEFADAGFTAGDLITLCDQIARISNLLPDHVRESESDFFSPAGRAAER